MTSSSTPPIPSRDPVETSDSQGTGLPRAKRGCVELGPIAAPTLSLDVAEQVRRELADTLARRYPGVRWEVTAVMDDLTQAPVHLTELVDATRQRMLAEDWQLAVCITDLPLRLAGRPMLTHTSPTHGIALISLPALGPFQVRRRLVEETAAAVGHLVGDPPRRRSGGLPVLVRPRVQRRLTELATEVETGSGVAFVARVLSGHLRLLLGMIRANHPWRLVARLSRALAGTTRRRIDHPTSPMSRRRCDRAYLPSTPVEVLLPDQYHEGICQMNTSGGRVGHQDFGCVSGW